jgi:hypothetical protein
MGSSFLIIEGVSRPRYAKVSREQASVALLAVEGQVESERQQLLQLLSAGQLDVAAGRALHPRYFHAGQGIAAGDFGLVAPMDFGRLTFYLIGPEPGSVILALDDLPIDVPASSDVVVFRCGPALETAAIIVLDEEESGKLIISSRLAESCQS